MKTRWLSNFTIILVLFCCQSLSAQLKDLTKKVTKAVKESVESVEIEFEVTKIKYDVLKDPNKLTVNMIFNGYNPNPIGIKLARIEFDIYVDEKLATKIYNDKEIDIPKEGEFSFKEKAKMKLSTVGKTVFKAIKDDKATYRIDGIYFVNTKIGEFKFKAELLEKEVGS